MPEIGEIDLTKLKGRYFIDDINFVDIRGLDYSNELRIYFEIFLSIDTGLLGATISKFNWYLLAGTMTFFLLWVIFLVRYLMKYNSLKINIKDGKKYYTAKLKAKYPKEKNGKTFQLIKSDAKRGYIYLLDFTTKEKYHIGSISTFRALEYDMSMVKNLDPDEFNLLKEGNKILIE